MYVTAASGLFVLSGYVVNVWLGRLLGPRDYGIFGIVVGLMTLLTNLQNAGVPQAVARYIAEDEPAHDAVLKTGLIVQLATAAVTTALLVASAPVLAFLLADPALVPYLYASAIVLIPHALFTLYVGYYNGLHSYGRQALAMSNHAVAKAVASIGLVYPLHLYGAIAGYLVGPVAALAVAFHWPRSAGSRFPFRRIVAFSLPLVAFFVLVSVQLSLDLFVVKATLPDEDAGYYTAAQNVARIPYYALGGVALIVTPAVATALRRGTAADGEAIVRRALRFALALLVPAAAVLATTGRGLVDVLYSALYLPAAAPLALLAVGVGCLAVFTLLGAALMGSGRPPVALLCGAAAVSVTGAACVLLTPRLGMVGAALGTTLGSLVGMLGASIAVSRLFPRFLSAASSLRILGAGAVVAIVGALVNPTGIGVLLTYAFLGTLYIVLLLALRELKPDDWNELRRLSPVSADVLRAE